MRYSLLKHLFKQGFVASQIREGNLQNPKRSAYYEGADLRGMDLSGITLSQINLTYADLRSVDFIGADLQKVNFTHANLQGADFTGANLQGSIFSYANLENTCFWEADLRRTDFDYSSLSEAIFRKANLKGAWLNHVSIDLGDGFTHLTCDDELMYRFLDQVSTFNFPKKKAFIKMLKDNGFYAKSPYAELLDLL